MPRTLQNGQPSRATGRNEAKRKRLFVLVGPDLAKLFAEQSSPWSEKISELFAAQVEDAFTSRSLRSSLRKFYAEHIDFFRQERATARLTLQIDDLIAGLASTLSFRLIRTGNTSALFRLLTRYHAICEGLLKAPVPSHPEHIAAAKNALESLRHEPLPPARVVKQKKLGGAKHREDYLLGKPVYGARHPVLGDAGTIEENGVVAESNRTRSPKNRNGENQALL